MVRLVNKEYLVDLVEQYYKEQKRNCSFCSDSNCIFCKNSKILEGELKKKNLILLILMLLFGKFCTTKMIQIFWILFQNIKMNSIVEVK